MQLVVQLLVVHGTPSSAPPSFNQFGRVRANSSCLSEKVPKLVHVWPCHTPTLEEDSQKQGGHMGMYRCCARPIGALPFGGGTHACLDPFGRANETGKHIPARSYTSARVFGTLCCSKAIRKRFPNSISAVLPSTSIAREDLYPRCRVLFNNLMRAMRTQKQEECLITGNLTSRKHIM